MTGTNLPPSIARHAPPFGRLDLLSKASPVTGRRAARYVFTREEAVRYALRYGVTVHRIPPGGSVAASPVVPRGEWDGLPEGTYWAYVYENSPNPHGNVYLEERYG